MRGRVHKLDWRRILVEFVIVTGGVLFALALDQWMESRKDRAEEQLLLDAVRTEFQAILESLDVEMDFRRAMMENANQIYAVAAADMPPDPAQFDIMMGKLLWWSSVGFTIGGVESILVGGKLRLIENEEIRFFLASLPERLATTQQVEANDYSTVVQVTAPYVLKNGDMSQVLMGMNTRPDGQARDEMEMRYHPKSPRDHTGFLKDPEFIGIVGAVAASQINVMAEYESLKPEFERVVGLLDAELAD